MQAITAVPYLGPYSYAVQPVHGGPGKADGQGQQLYRTWIQTAMHCLQSSSCMAARARQTGRAYSCTVPVYLGPHSYAVQSKHGGPGQTDGQGQQAEEAGQADRQQAVQPGQINGGGQVGQARQVQVGQRQLYLYSVH